MALLHMLNLVFYLAFLTRTCGSACSQSTTRAYVDGLATVVTIGGIQDQSLDISSFNGGNVLDGLGDFWKKYRGATLTAYFRTPELPPEEAVFLPVPMAAFIRFNNRQQTPKAFGDNAMPREFYRVHGSRRCS